MKKELNRKVYLINPAFQLKIIGYALFIAVVTIAVFYMSNLFFIGKLVAIGKSLDFPADHSFFLFIREQKRMMHSVFFGTASLVVLTILVGGVILSHRIAGPIYRLQEYLESIVADRTFKKLTFRKTDFFYDLAESINKTLGLLQSKGPLPESTEAFESKDS